MKNSEDDIWREGFDIQQSLLKKEQLYCRTDNIVYLRGPPCEFQCRGTRFFLISGVTVGLHYNYALDTKCSHQETSLLAIKEIHVSCDQYMVGLHHN